MMTLLADDDSSAQSRAMTDLARLLSHLSNDEVNTIIYQSAVEMAAKERSRSASEGSTTSSPRGEVKLWEMQAPTNTYNLAGLLAILDDHDESCIITVRKIHRLGFKSARYLRKHFQQFGTVDKILILPSRPKTSDSELKPRPASMGFIVMQSAAAATAALKEKDTHLIQGWTVYAQKFVRRENALESADDLIF
jgi:hypothetical protein